MDQKKKYIKKQNSRFIQIGTPNSSNATNKNSLSLSVDHEVSKKIKNSIEATKSAQSVYASPFKKTIFSQDNKSEEKNQIKDDSPLLATAGYNVEVSEAPEIILTKLQKKDSLNPNFKFVTVDSSLKESNSNKRKSKSQITQMNDGSKEKNIKKQNSLFIKIGTPNALNTNHKKSLSISADHGGSVSKSIKNNIESAKAEQFLNAPSINITPDNKIGGKNQINDEPPFQVPAEFNVEVPETTEKILTKPQKKVSLNPNFKSVSVNSTLKELTKMGEIVKGGKIGKSMWKVRHFDNVNTLKENFNLNASWTVSDETKIDDTNTVCGTDDEPPLLVPAGFNVEVSEAPEKTPTKIQKKVSLTPNFKSLTVDSSLKESNSNKRKSKSPISKINEGSNKKIIQKQNSPFIKTGTPNLLNASLNNSWSVSADNGGSASKKVKKSIESAKALQAVNSSPINDLTPDNGVEEKNQTSDDLVISKLKRRSNEINTNSSLNESWSVCSDEKLKLSKSKSPVSNTVNEPNKKSIQKSNSPFVKISSPNVANTSHNNSWSVSADSDGSASKKVKKSNEPGKEEKRISLTSVSTPDKSSKSPKSPKSPTPEQRVLRRRTIIIPKKKPDGQNEGTPKRKVKEPSATKVSQKRRKTIAGEEISMLKPEEISNKALEKVVS